MWFPTVLLHLFVIFLPQTFDETLQIFAHVDCALVISIIAIVVGLESKQRSLFSLCHLPLLRMKTLISQDVDRFQKTRLMMKNLL